MSERQATQPWVLFFGGVLRKEVRVRRDSFFNSLSFSLFSSLSLAYVVACWVGGKEEKRGRKKVREREGRALTRATRLFRTGEVFFFGVCSPLPAPISPSLSLLLFLTHSPQGRVAGPPLAPSVSKQTQQSGVVVPTRDITSNVSRLHATVGRFFYHSRAVSDSL